jgi:hypothetical protein
LKYAHLRMPARFYDKLLKAEGRPNYSLLDLNHFVLTSSIMGKESCSRIRDQCTSNLCFCCIIKPGTKLKQSQQYSFWHLDLPPME